MLAEPILAEQVSEGVPSSDAAFYEDAEGDGLRNRTGTTESDRPSRGRFGSIPLVDDGYGTKSGIAGASANFINSIIGAGIIGLPAAVKQCGFFFGLFLIGLVAWMTDYSVRLLVRTAKRVGCDSYEAVCEYTMGKTGYYLCAWFIFLGSFGAQVAYLIVLGDTACPVFEAYVGKDNLLAERHFLITISSIIFMLPLFLQRDLSSFSATSSLSLLAVAVIVIMVVIRAPAVAAEQAITSENSPNAYAFIDSHLFSGIGTMSFAFVCHQGAFIVLDSLENPTVQRWKIVTHISVFAALLVSLILIFVGYCSFLDRTDPNILNNFANDDGAINAARILLALTMILTYPVNAFVTRYSLHTILFKGEPEISRKEHYISTFGLFFASLLPGALLKSLGPVMALVGALTSCSVGYVLPVLCYFGVNPWRPLWREFKGAWLGREPERAPESFSTGGDVVDEGDDVYCWAWERALGRRRAASCRHFVSPLCVLLFGLVSMVAGSVDAFL